MEKCIFLCRAFSTLPLWFNHYLSEYRKCHSIKSQDFIFEYLLRITNQFIFVFEVQDRRCEETPLGLIPLWLLQKPLGPGLSLSSPIGHHYDDHFHLHSHSSHSHLCDPDGIGDLAGDSVCWRLTNSIQSNSLLMRDLLTLSNKFCWSDVQ